MTDYANKFRVGAIGYIPPKRIAFTDAFEKNIRRYKTKFSLILFRDDGDMHEGDIAIPPIDQSVRFRSMKRPWTANNLVFFQAVQIAMHIKLDWFIYLEADCRVRGDYWDDAMFNEFFSFHDPIWGGSPVCHDISCSGHDTLKHATEFAHWHLNHTGVAMPIYAAGIGRGKTCCFYPNGAGGVYNVESLRGCFPGIAAGTESLGHLAAQTTAWDMELGYRMWRLIGNEVFPRFASLRSAFSGYGETLVSEQERKDMLETGGKVLVHQIKSHWCP